MHLDTETVPPPRQFKTTRHGQRSEAARNRCWPAQTGLPGVDAPADDADTRAALIAQLLSGRTDAAAILTAAAAAVAAAPPTPVASTPALSAHPVQSS